MTLYCPTCWHEVDAGAALCPHCGADLTQSRGSYTAKLIAALRHPEPWTQRRAAYVLGLVADPDVVDALIETMASEADVYVRGEVACALGKIGGAAALAALEQVAVNAGESTVVRHAAADALAAARENV